MANRGFVRETEDERRRRKVIARRVAIGFFVFLGIVIFLESPMTRVRGISVDGNRVIPKDRVIAESSLHPGMSLWQVSRGRVEQSVMSFEPLVDSVAVHTDYLHGQVTLHLREKPVVAVLVAHSGNYELLGDGTVYTPMAKDAGFPWPAVTVDGVAAATIGDKLENPFVPELCSGLQAISGSLSSDVSEIHVDRFGVVTMYLNNGFAGQCRASQVAVVLTDLYHVVAYFSHQGYPPGLIDMTGTPPYRYTPFSTRLTKGAGG